MTLLFVDGFDHYDTTGIIAKWTARDAFIESINTTAGRRGGGALYNPAGGYAQKTFSGSYSTIIAGFAIKFLNSGGSLFSLWNAGQIHLALTVVGNKIALRRGNATNPVIATGTFPITTGIWYYVECKAFISDTVGTVETRINGVTDINFSGDTKDVPDAGIDQFQIGDLSYTASSVQAYFDDLYFGYVNTAPGSKNNDFLGDCRVDTLYATGAGNYTDFTPSSGTNYSCINKTIASDTPYITNNVLGARDSYTYGDLPSLSASSVYGVQVAAYAKKTDTGFRSLGTMARSGGINADGVGLSLNESPQFVNNIYEQDPASGDWTQSSVNAAEFGVKVTG